MDDYKEAFERISDLVYDIQAFENENGLVLNNIIGFRSNPDRGETESFIVKFKNVLFRGNLPAHLIEENWALDKINADIIMTAKAGDYKTGFSEGKLFNLEKTINYFIEFEKEVKKRFSWITRFSKGLQIENESIFLRILNYYQKQGRLEWDDDELFNGGRIEVRGGDEGIWILSLFEILQKRDIIKNIVAKMGSIKKHTDRIETYFCELPPNLNAMYKKNRKPKEGKGFYHQYIDKIKEELTAANIIPQ